MGIKYVRSAILGIFCRVGWTSPFRQTLALKLAGLGNAAHRRRLVISMLGDELQDALTEDFRPSFEEPLDCPGLDQLAP
jgi:hypothetical protein